MSYFSCMFKIFIICFTCGIFVTTFEHNDFYELSKCSNSTNVHLLAMIFSTAMIRASRINSIYINTSVK